MTCSIARSITIAMTTLALGCTPGSGNEDGGSTGATTSSSGETSGGSDEDSTTSGGPTTSTAADSTDSSTSTLDTSDDDPACALPPVEEDVAGQLFIYGANSGFVASGGSAGLSLAWIDFGFPTVVDACVEWSIAPVRGVSIEADGVVNVAPEVPPGTIVTVTADLEDGRRLITTDLEVYVPLVSPILGFWGEVQQLPCDGSDPFEPEPIIPELIFYNTGEFTVTWTPFEVYIDYGGTFTHDVGTGALSLTVNGGNYVPDDIDAEGTATVIDGQLMLEDMWLGTAQDPVTAPACGHVFE